MPTAPFQSNTYVPEVTDKLVVSFSRNPSKFPLNQYVQIVPVDLQVGLYLRMDREEAGRLKTTDGKEFDWPDSADRPTHHGETEDFQFLAYKTQRKDFGVPLGDLSVEQAKWDVVGSQAGPKAEQAMRLRTQRVVTQAVTTGNYDATHVSAISGGSIPGTAGNWAASTTARKDIKRSINHATEIIMKDSLNGVEPENLVLVIGPGLASAISVSQEIVDHIKGSTDAYLEVQGKLPNRNILFGLPNRLYGIELIIENTYKVTSKKGASSVARSAILPDATPFMASRVGGLVDERMSSAPSFSTLVLFMKEEMTVEQFREAQNKHRRLECHVTEDYAAILAAPVAGFLFTGAM